MYSIILYLFKTFLLQNQTHFHVHENFQLIQMEIFQINYIPKKIIADIL